MPLTIKHMHGAAQSVVFTQEAPSSCRAGGTCPQLADGDCAGGSTDMNIEANRTLFIIGINYLLFPGRGWAFRLADARGPSARAKTTAAWTFTDVAGGAETSTGHNCLRSGSQLMDRYSARRKSGREHRCEHEFSGHVTCSFSNAVFKYSVAKSRSKS